MRLDRNEADRLKANEKRREMTSLWVQVDTFRGSRAAWLAPCFIEAPDRVSSLFSKHSEPVPETHPPSSVSLGSQQTPLREPLPPAQELQTKHWQCLCLLVAVFRRTPWNNLLHILSNLLHASPYLWQKQFQCRTSSTRIMVADSWLCTFLPCRRRPDSQGRTCLATVLYHPTSLVPWSRLSSLQVAVPLSIFLSVRLLSHAPLLVAFYSVFGER